MSFGLTDNVRACTRTGAGWWRSAFGVASVAMALLLGLPVAARASEQPLGLPTAAPDDGASQHPTEAQSAPERADDAVQHPAGAQSVSEPGMTAGNDQAPNAVELGKKDAGGRATRGEVAAPSDLEASDPAAPPKHLDDARAAAWQARAASSGTAAASERSSQLTDSDNAQRTHTGDHEHAGLGSQTSAPTAQSRSTPPTPSASARVPAPPDGEAPAGVPADRQRPGDTDYEDTPRLEGIAAAPPALRQRVTALPRRAYRDARRSTAGRTDVRSSGVEHVGATTAPTIPVTTARGSVRAHPNEPDKHGHARTSTRQRTLPMPPPSRRSAETTSSQTIASGSGAFGESPVAGGLIAWALATGAIWFMLRERAHRMRPLLWATPLERPG